MSAQHIDPVSGDLIPPTTQGSDPEPLWWNEEAGSYVRPWWAVLKDASRPMDGESEDDEEDCEGCDGDGLLDENRCEECGRLLDPEDSRGAGLCYDCVAELEAEAGLYYDNDDED